MKIDSAIKQLVNFRVAQNYSSETIKSMTSYLKILQEFLDENAIEGTKQISFNVLMKFQQYVSTLEFTIGSKNQIIYATRALLIYLNESGENIRGASMIKPLRMPITIPKTLKKNSVDRLFNVIEDKRDLLIVSLMFWSGLRVGEVHRLSTFDIDLESRTLRILGKGNIERLAVYPVHIKLMLQEYLENTRVSYYNSLETQALFISKKGNRLSIRGLQVLVKQYGRKAELEETISPHWLRRSLATYLIHAKKDLNIMVLARYLGHQSINTLKFYTKFEVSDLKELIDQVLEDKKAP